MTRGTISVVVVNFRTPDLTAEAVRSALAEREVVEAIVVDNGSGDGSVEQLGKTLSGLAARLVPSEVNSGFGAGANRGAAVARGDMLFFLNSDAILMPGSIGRMLQSFGPGIGAVAPLVLGPDGRTPQADAFGSFPSPRTLVFRTKRRPEHIRDPDWVSGVALLVQRSTFEQIGGFDDSYQMYLEDVDLCRRIRQAGWTVRRARDATVVHLGGGSYGSSTIRDAAYHQSLLLYLRKAGYPVPIVSALAPAHLLWQRGRRAVRRLRNPRVTTG